MWSTDKTYNDPIVVACNNVRLASYFFRYLKQKLSFNSITTVQMLVHLQFLFHHSANTSICHIFEDQKW